MEAINKLTLGDVAAVESLSGMSISAIGDDEQPKGKALAALVFVIKRKSDSDFTFEDAMNMTMEEASEVLGLDNEEDPKALN